MEDWRRLFIVIGGFIEALLFSGCLFGWGSLVHVLQQEEVFYHLCGSNGLTDLSGANRLDKQPSINESNADGAILRDILFETSTHSPIWAGAMDVNYRSLSYDVSPTTLNPEIASANSSLAQHETQQGNNISSKHFAKRCRKQDEKFNLIYVVASVNYGLTAFFVGFSLDRFGLRATRIVAGLMTTGGFSCLAFTSKALPWLLWPALNLISLGTIQLRQSSFQFANAYPKRRATIINAYSGAYAISTILFLLIQYAYKTGISYQTAVLILTAISTFTIPLTFVMPVMKIEDHIESKVKPPPGKDSESNDSTVEKELYKDDLEETEDEMLHSAVVYKVEIQDTDKGEYDLHKPSTDDDSAKSGDQSSDFSTNVNVFESAVEEGTISLKQSLFSLSALLHLHWHFINFFLVLFYSATFIPWAYQITDDPNEVTFFNEISGLCQLIAPVFVPFAGFVTDILTKKALRYEDAIERKVAQLEAPAYALLVATIFLIALLTCKMFITRAAIYASMVLIAISRPMVVGCCTTYIRLRFPSEHFNRLFGIFTTSVSFICLSQYLIFKWMNSSPANSVKGHWILMVVLILSLASPGHMLLRCLTRKYARQVLKFDNTPRHCKTLD